jgi:hypothetical protein
MPSSDLKRKPIPIAGRISNSELQHEIDETLKILGDTRSQKGRATESSKLRKKRGGRDGNSQG